MPYTKQRILPLLFVRWKRKPGSGVIWYYASLRLMALRENCFRKYMDIRMTVLMLISPIMPSILWGYIRMYWLKRIYTTGEIPRSRKHFQEPKGILTLVQPANTMI